MSRRFVVLAALLLQGSLAAAAQPVEIQPQRSARILATGGLVWEDHWKPDLPAIGGIYQLSLARSSVTTDELGTQIIGAPSWFGHAGLLAAYGVSSGEELYGVGTLGLVYRLQRWPWLTSCGLVVSGVLPQRKVGPGARIEILDNLALQAGVVFGDRGPSALVTIDYMYGLWADVGLARAR